MPTSEKVAWVLVAMLAVGLLVMCGTVSQFAPNSYKPWRREYYPRLNEWHKRREKRRQRRETEAVTALNSQISAPAGYEWYTDRDEDGQLVSGLRPKTGPLTGEEGPWELYVRGYPAATPAESEPESTDDERRSGRGA